MCVCVWVCAFAQVSCIMSPVCLACSSHAKAFNSFLFPLPPCPCFHPSPHLQAPICSLTARRSVRLWATLIAAGCRASCPPTGARARTTAATSTCPAWTQSRTQRYLKAPSKRLISHSPPLVKRRLSVTNTSTTKTTTTFSKTITSATTRAP